MYPITCKNSTSGSKFEFILRTKTSTVPNVAWWSSSDLNKLLVNYTNTNLSAGSYSIDLNVTYNSVDPYREYTVSIYSPKKVRITNALGVENETNNKTHNYTFVTPDANAFLKFVNTSLSGSTSTSTTATTGTTNTTTTGTTNTTTTGTTNTTTTTTTNTTTASCGPYNVTGNLTLDLSNFSKNKSGLNYTNGSWYDQYDKVFDLSTTQQELIFFASTNSSNFNLNMSMLVFTLNT
jgi:hypothetical protein